MSYILIYIYFLLNKFYKNIKFISLKGINTQSCLENEFDSGSE